ncbi:MAG: peptidoglycan DD-metalloendopeptidase family protein [Clostridiales bacterium]|nr:peptidoglycan DD-metalloendopeptidase family protein [Clostridiales bacterium]
MRKKIVILFLILATAFLACGFAPKEEKSYIKWVDCNVPYQVLQRAYELDVKYHDSDKVEFDFEKSLAYLATKNGNKFNVKTDLKRLGELEKALLNDKKIDDFYGGNKYYKYYVESYEAIFSQFIGEYIDTSTNEKCYGLKNYHPIAANFWYSHYDDFGVSRSYGFKRKHLGHDIMGSVGTPIVAVEDGIITDIGWNKYGGWRLGIRSLDNKRSYYYAHLRKGHPYAENIKNGDKVAAGQVIGYLGVTGYSAKEDVNMKCKPHLHIGMQLIFDECQIQGPKEIWIDMYQITKFLSSNRAKVVKDGKNYKSINLKRSID